MALRRALVVSLILALVALGSAWAGPPTAARGRSTAGPAPAAPGSSAAGLATVTLDGRSYVDASSLAARVDAKIERSPERVHLRTKSHVVTLTRGWARVEVDGKAVVLEAPVRVVEGGRWLVPEAFMRQVMPILEGKSVAAQATAPKVSATAPAGRAPEAPQPAPATQEPRVKVEAPRPASQEPPVRAYSSRPLPPTPLARPLESPATPASPPAAMPSPSGTPPEESMPAVSPSPRALDAPKWAPRSMVIEAPRTGAPAVARAVEPAKASPSAAAPAIKSGMVGATLEDLRLRSYPTFTRVVVETSATVRARVDVVGPKELRIRLASVSTIRRAEDVRDGLLESVHVEPAEGDAVVRVAFTGASQEPKMSALSDPPRLLFDFPRAEPTPRAPLAAPGPLRTLVLDAGHGGHDSGAVGPAGLMEKDLVLDVTRRVASLVEAHLPGIAIRLTRKGDTFVPLRDRTSFANRERADLFVSIHANAHRESHSEGVETYFLSSEATDGAARQVAAAENSVVKLEKPVARGSRADVVKAILWDLAQSEFQQESSRLAEVVQDSMTQSLKIPNRGVKQAGFYVLGGAAMPAILVEIGFVTNPREERRLKDSAYRDEIARAIFAGIAEYKQDLDRRAARAASR